jgi:putative FmdB family regulatory protein
VPIYEYQCTKCGEVFEAFQKINDEPIKKCRFCHGRVDKLISHTSFQLKGSGWYLTDYSRKPQPSDKGTGTAKDATTSSESKGGSGSEPSAASAKSSESKS